MFIALCVVLVLIPAVVIAAFPAFAALSFRRARRDSGRMPRVRLVSVIMPVAGPEENFASCVRSLCAQRTSFDVEFIFAVDDPRDALVALARNAFSGDARAVRVVFAEDTGDGLGKMRNLIAGARAAHGDVFVFLDSDTVLDHPSFLERLVSDTGRPTVGMVTCFPAYRHAACTPAALLASTINHDLLGYFALFHCWDALRSANGSCLAITRLCLASIGGLEPLRAQLLMDSRLAQRVVRAGWRVHLHEHGVPVPKENVSGLAGWHQVQRWQTSMSRVLPRGQYLAFVWMRTGGMAALILAAIAPVGMREASLLFLAGYFVMRLLSASLLNRYWIRDPVFARHAGLLPVVELLNGVTAIVAVFYRTVVWRDGRYRVARDGTAVALAATRVRDDTESRRAAAL